MLEECCGEGYIWSIPYGSLNYCFLTQGTTVRSHVATISQSCVLAAQYATLLNVQSQCWICAAMEGSYIVSQGSFMEKNKRQIVCGVFMCGSVQPLTHTTIMNLRMFFNNNVFRGNKTKKCFDISYDCVLKRIITQWIFCILYIYFSKYHMLTQSVVQNFCIRHCHCLDECCCSFLRTLPTVLHCISYAYLANSPSFGAIKM